jgi:hypothetical protein
MKLVIRHKSSNFGKGQESVNVQTHLSSMVYTGLASEFAF